MPDLSTNLNNIFKRRDKFIERNMADASDEFVQLEQQLLKGIMTKYISKLEYVDGKLVFSTKNLAAIDKLDDVFTAFEERFARNTFKSLGQKMLDLSVYSKEYYAEFGAQGKTLKAIEKSLEALGNSIGINAKGELIANSYLDRLASSEAMKVQIKDYVAKSLAEKTNLTSFQDGLRSLVEGADGKGGELSAYFETETHDAFYSTARATDDVFAQELGLNFAMYLPGEIETSRPFCKGGFDKVCGCDFDSKINKMFHREEINRWKDIEWSGKKPSNNPIIDLGGYNCRHSLYWISDEQAKDIDPEKYAEWVDVEVSE